MTCLEVTKAIQKRNQRVNGRLNGTITSSMTASLTNFRRVLSDNSESEQEAEEKLNENDMDTQEVDEEDDRAFKRQRIEVELTMPELPLPTSKDDKVIISRSPVVWRQYINISLHDSSIWPNYPNS